MSATTLPPDAALLARGLTAEVYAWDADTVLKLFLPHTSEFSADNEARCGAVLADSHLPLARFFSRIEIQGRLGLLFERVAGPSGLEVICRAPWRLLPVLHAAGQVPLPPYIRRDTGPDARDAERYQTLYAAQPGSVAAPTASLHFDAPLLARLEAQGLRRATVTLHVGAGTFQPVRVQRISEHRMHAERFEIPPATAAAIARTRARGGQVIAVGTTSLRALEAAAEHGELHAGAAETDIFITPGYRFRVVDRLITNFHLPKSTLLMLVSAFAGLDAIRGAYRHAINQRYRFFSYGDAMLLHRG